MRAHNEAVNFLDVIEGRDEITVDYAPGTVETVASTTARFCGCASFTADYDPTTGSRP